MALENLISVKFTDDELKTIDDSLTAIEGVLAGKVINLTPEERSQYGRIGNKTENWITKINGYMSLTPDLVPNYIDKTEFAADFKARHDIQPRLNRLSSVFESLDDTQKLISSDLFTNCIAYYRNLKISSQQNVPGSTGQYDDLKAQFPGKPKAKDK